MQYQVQENRIFAEDKDGRLLAEVTFPETAPGICTIDHTFVDASLRGQGVAGRLVSMAAVQIMERGGRIAATCSYAQRWLQEHRVVNVRQIFDGDYGCEESPAGSQCSVLVQDADGNEQWISITDSELNAYSITEGCIAVLPEKLFV